MVLWIILWIFIFLLTLLLLLIFVPIQYRMEGTIGRHSEFTARLHWMFFVKAIYQEEELAIKIGPYKRQMTFDKLEDEEEVVKKRSRMNIKDIALLAKLDMKSIASLGILMFKRLWRKIKPKIFLIKGTIGFTDPCTTGQFLGFYEAASHAIGFREAVDLKGDFEDSCLDLNVKMAGGFAVASLAGPVIRFLWQKPVRDGIKLMRKGDLDE